MTSPDPHGRETVETVQTVEIGETPLAYSGGFIDRAANQRSDPGFLDATLAKASTRLIPPGGVRRRLRKPGGRGAARGRRGDGRARRDGDVHSLPGLALPVRGNDRVPGHRARGVRARGRRGGGRGPLVYPR